MPTYIYDIFININHATIGPQWVGWDGIECAHVGTCVATAQKIVQKAPNHYL